MSDIRIIKRKAKGFFQSQDLPIINQAIQDVHNIVTDASVLLRAFYLQWFQENHPLQNNEDALELNIEMLTMACNIVQGATKLSTRKETDDNGKLDTFNKMLDSYNKLYQRLNFNANVDTQLSLSHILSYSKTNMLTAYENNIKCHFKKYPKRYITCDILSKTDMDATSAKKLANAVCNHFLYDMLIEDSYTQLMTTHSLQLDAWGILFPDKMTKKQLPRCWDLKVHPWVYLYRMVWINQCLEIDFPSVKPKYRKLLNPLPFHSSFIPMHIRLDTSGISQLLMSKQRITDFKELYYIETGIKLNMSTKGDMLSSFEKLHGREMNNKKEGGMYATKMWSFLTNLTSCRQWKDLQEHEMKNDPLHRKWVFDNAIITDGVSISFQTIDESKFGRKDLVGKKNNKKKGSAQEEFSEGFSDDEIANNKATSCDPGKKEILAITDGITTIKYTRGQRQNDTFLNERRKVTRKRRINDGVLDYESKWMNQYCKRSCHLHTFERYACSRKRKQEQLSKCYSNRCFREFKFLAYVSTKSSEDKFADRVFQTFKESNTKNATCTNSTIQANAAKEVQNRKDIIIGWGNWGKHPNAVKAGCPSPGIGIRRRFQKLFNTATIEEKYTSQICPCCQGRTLENPGKNEGISITRHHLLRCTNDNCKSRWWNRNVSASFNILCRTLKIAPPISLGNETTKVGLRRKATSKALNLGSENA